MLAHYLSDSRDYQKIYATKHGDNVATTNQQRGALLSFYVLAFRSAREW
jgi:hypothetical protein